MKPRAAIVRAVRPALAGALACAAACALAVEPARVELGRALFFESRLSADGTVSCASCHQPARAFTDGRATSQGTRGRTSSRNTPSLLDVSRNTPLFWDGRGRALRDHAADALLNPLEHGLESFDEVRHAIAGAPKLGALFVAAFGKEPGTAEPGEIAEALAAFLETLTAGDSAFDRYFTRKERHALSPAAARGLELFRGRAACSSCHTIGESAAPLSDRQFHSLGVGRERIERRLPELVKRLQAVDPKKLGHAVLADPALGALGRFAVTRKPADVGKFRTPSLRNVALTAPYMHDGSVATLEEAIELELYYRTFASGRPITLSIEEKADLLEFLKSLTSSAAAGHAGR
jgi:cytochrome c peroxidase